MEFAKLSAPSLKDLFVQQLQGMILSDELPMGTQLPPERELAQQMQVSRAVVNGGLAELASRASGGGGRGRELSWRITDARGTFPRLSPSWSIRAACWARMRYALFWRCGARWSIWLRSVPSVMPRMKRWHAWGYCGAHRRSAEQRAGG